MSMSLINHPDAREIRDDREYYTGTAVFSYLHFHCTLECRDTGTARLYFILTDAKRDSVSDVGSTTAHHGRRHPRRELRLPRK